VVLNSNRRKHERFKYENSISHDIIALEVVYAGRIYNFSNGGLYFECDHILHDGKEICMWIGSRPQLAEAGVQPFVCVEIIRHQKLRNSLYRFGYGARIIKTADALTRHMSKAKLTGNNLASAIGGDGIDSRKFPRRHYNKFFLYSHQNQRCKGYIKNISRSGALIETENKLSLGGFITLAVPGRKNRKNIYIKGWIVRLSKKGGGVKFDQRSGRERRSDLDRRYGLERRSRAGFTARDKILR
jgi:hypothetical protein